MYQITMLYHYHMIVQQGQQLPPLPLTSTEKGAEEEPSPGLPLFPLRREAPSSSSPDITEIVVRSAPEDDIRAPGGGAASSAIWSETGPTSEEESPRGGPSLEDLPSDAT